MSDTLKREEIPKWIKNSPVYKSGKYKNFKKKNVPIYPLELSTLNDFRKILRVINFWKIPHPYSSEIWKYIFVQYFPKNEFGIFGEHPGFLKHFNKIKDFLKKNKEKFANRYFLKYFTIEIDVQLKLAIENNEFELIRLANKYKCGMKRLCYYCVEYDNLEILSYARSPEGDDSKVYPWDEEVCECAAREGNLEILIYLHENGCPWNEKTCSAAAGKGHYECLTYAHENSCPWDKFACTTAASNGQLECLEYLHAPSGEVKNGCPWNELTCKYAAENGYLDCLTYAHKNGCEITGYTLEGAAVSIGCLKYLVKNNCPRNINNYDNSHEIVENAINNFECFKFLLENKFSYSKDELYETILKKGSIECLKYLYERDPLLVSNEEWFIKKAIYGKSVECLKFLHINGFKLGNKVCYYAALFNSLECLAYAHECNCYWDEETCEIAALRGNYKCLEYLHKNGCPWNRRTVIAAAENGHLECLKYAHENGCFINGKMLKMKFDYKEINDYLASFKN